MICAYTIHSVPLIVSLGIAKYDASLLKEASPHSFHIISAGTYKIWVLMSHRQQVDIACEKHILLNREYLFAIVLQSKCHKKNSLKFCKKKSSVMSTKWKNNILNTGKNSEWQVQCSTKLRVKYEISIFNSWSSISKRFSDRNKPQKLFTIGSNWKKDTKILSLQGNKT